MPPFPVDPEKDTICDVTRRWADVQPDAPAIIEEGKTPLTYGALTTVMDEIRGALNDSGLGCGDRIGVVHSGGADMASLILGVISGATAVPLDPRPTADEFAIHFCDRNVKALIIEPDVSQAAVEAAQRLGLSVLETQIRKSGGEETVGITATAKSKPARPYEAHGDDIALVFGTSSTTGRSKIVPRSHRNLLARVAVEEKTIELGPDDIGVVMRPLYYSGPFNNVLSALYTGGAIVVLPKFEAQAFFDTLRKNRATWYSGGPTFQRAIYAHAIKHPEDTADIRLGRIRVGTASLESEIADGLDRLFSTSVSTSYGSTESGRITFNYPAIGPRRKGTVGVSIARLGIAGSEVRIRAAGGEFLPAGACGEIVVRGPQVFEGYENDEAANAAAFVDGWFRTGDEGFFDDDGYLTLTGRIKEIINRGGEKVSPAEVDAALIAHSKVREAATFPIPHPTLGEEVAAAVVAERGSGLDNKDLTDHLLQRLSGFKVPKHFFFVEEIPKSEYGKVQRYKLADALGVKETIAELRQAGSREERQPTPFEARLQELWEKTLRIDHVGLEDDFFMLGGDSLQAVELMVGIEARFGIRIPVETLFEASTIVTLSKHLESDTGVVWSDLITIREGECAPSIVCIHGGDGDILWGFTFASHMPRDYGVYGCRWTFALAGDKTTVEAIAERYCKAIEQSDMAMPIVLMGYSSGGLIAFEMAQQLRAKGNNPAAIVILDMPAPGAGSLWWPAVRHLREAVEAPISEIVPILVRRAGNFLGRCFAHVSRYGERIWGRQGRKPNPAKKIYSPAVRAYTPLPYDGDVFLVSATREAPTWQPKRNMGWAEIVHGRLDICEVEATHLTLFNEEPMRGWAQALSDYIGTLADIGPVLVKPDRTGDKPF